MSCNLILAVILLPLLTSSAGAPPDEGNAVDARQRLSEMGAADKQELDGKRARFYGLPKTEQEQLRKVHRDLCEASDGERLRSVMERYSTWLRSLPSGQRAELLSLPPESRLAQIKLLLEQQEQWRMRNYVMPELTASDLAVIVQWMEDFVVAHESEILERIPHLRERWESIEPSRRPQALIFSATMGPRDLLRPSDEDIQQLKEKLSASAKAEIAKAEREGRLGELAQSWIRAAMFSRRSGPPVAREELQRFYKELDARQREYLENLPAERMEQELTRFYHFSRFRKFFDPDRPPFSRPGDGFRGRGRGPWPGGDRSPDPSSGDRPKGPPFGPMPRQKKPSESPSAESEDSPR